MTELARAQSFPDPYAPVFCYGLTGKKSAAEANLGYLSGYNEIHFYDGDNALTSPAKTTITLDSAIAGMQFETFPARDLAVRIQAWINRPERHRDDFLFSRSNPATDANDPIFTAWDTKARFLGADLSVVYHLGMGGTPYTAGLILGYRYNNFDYSCQAANPPGGDFQDKINVHIPHLGVYYANGKLLGSVVRLDLLASPFTLTKFDGQRRLAGLAGSVSSVMSIDAHALTGAWYEAYLQCAWPVTTSLILGLFARYDYMKLSGGATVDTNFPGNFTSTRFSMESRHNFIVLGLAATYAF